MSIHALLYDGTPMRVPVSGLDRIPTDNTARLAVVQGYLNFPTGIEAVNGIDAIPAQFN
jgi:hypothetical protein